MVNVLVTQFLPNAYKKYVESNIRLSSSFRKYKPNLPKWLHNRPRQFVDHCKVCITHAESIKDRDIECKENRHFEVQSSTSSGLKYHAYFGLDDEMPFCECLDWKKHHWPCKHFIAIFNWEPEWGWDSLGSCYRQNEIFCVDEQSVANFSGKVQPPETLQDINTPEVEPSVMNESSVKQVTTSSHSVQAGSSLARSRKAISCREIMQEISNMTYLCTENKAMEDLEEGLRGLRERFATSIKSDYGLFLNDTRSRVNPKKKTSKPPQGSVKYQQLPLRRKRKKLSKRAVHVPIPEEKENLSSNPTAIPTAHDETYDPLPKKFCHDLPTEPIHHTRHLLTQQHPTQQQATQQQQPRQQQATQQQPRQQQQSAQQQQPTQQQATQQQQPTQQQATQQQPRQQQQATQQQPPTQQCAQPAPTASSYVSRTIIMNKDAPRRDLEGVRLPPVGCNATCGLKLLYGKFKSTDALQVLSRPPETLVTKAIAIYARGQDKTNKPTGVFIQSIGSFSFENLRILCRYCDIAKIKREVKSEEKWLKEHLHGAPMELVETAKKHLLGCSGTCTVLSMRGVGVLKVEALACLALERYINKQVIDMCLQLAEEDANRKNSGVRQVACLTVPECDNLY